MKAFLFFFILLCHVPPLVAATVHTFMICNTNDPKIGASSAVNQTKITKLFTVTALTINYGYENYLITDDDFTVTNLNKTIQNADIGPEDIVVLYISAHGNHPENSPDIFPNVMMDQTISSSNLHYRFRETYRKYPKILISIVETCNNFTQGESKADQSIEPGLPPRSVMPTVPNAEIVKKLFSEPFDLIICAGQPGMKTYADNAQGSVFTNAFIGSYKLATSTAPSANPAKPPADPSWDLILQRSKINTYQRTKGCAHPHFPVWEQVYPYPAYGITGSGENCIDSLSKNMFTVYVSKLNTTEALVDSMMNAPRHTISCYIQCTGIEHYNLTVDSVIYYINQQEPVCQIPHTPLKLHTSAGEAIEVRAILIGRDGTRREYYGLIPPPKITVH